MKLSGQDAALLVVIADTELAASTFLSKLLDPLNLVVGASIVTDTVSPLTPPKVMVDIMIDTAYQNNQHTVTC